MSDKIVVMADGKIQQVGKPEEVYQLPENAFVADFIGESNIFDAEMTGENEVSIHGIPFTCTEEFPVGDRVEVVIRPEAVKLTTPEKGKIQGEVYSSVFKGTAYEITIYSGKTEIVARSMKSLETGMKVGVSLEPEGIHIMPYNDRINHYVGVLDEELRLRLVDGSVPVREEILFPNGHPGHVEGIKVQLFFEPGAAMLSDDPREGLVQGNIISIIYKGDHYKYKVRSKNDIDYYVDDEWLWNMGDYVSVIVPEDKRHYQLMD